MAAFASLFVAVADVSVTIPFVMVAFVAAVFAE